MGEGVQCSAVQVVGLLASTCRGGGCARVMLPVALSQHGRGAPARQSAPRPGIMRRQRASEPRGGGRSCGRASHSTYNTHCSTMGSSRKAQETRRPNHIVSRLSCFRTSTAKPACAYASPAWRSGMPSADLALAASGNASPPIGSSDLYT